MNCDIALYGHLTFDEVFHENKVTTNVGGIANVWRSLKIIDNTLNVQVIPLSVGDSRIVIKNNVKDNYSNLNRTIYHNVNMVKAKVSHVAYLNELKTFDFVDSLYGIKTADLCTVHENEGTPLSLTIAEKFDIIFVSEEHLHLLPEGYTKRLIVHGPTSSSCFENGSHMEFYEDKVNFLSDINTLGAGDYFASQYICKIVRDNDRTPSLKYVQTMTTEYLKERHEKT